jgi:hypothetical protein
LLSSGIAKLVSAGSELQLARHTVRWFFHLDHFGGRRLCCSALAKTGPNNNQRDNNDDDQETTENDKAPPPINRGGKRPRHL